MNSQYPATFDYVCHPLRCPRCARIPTDPCEIDMQTKLARVKELRSLRLGDDLEPSDRPDVDGGYLRLREQGVAGQLVAIETWTCPNCSSGFLWARLVIQNGRVASIEPTDLSEAALASADFITAQALMLFPMERTLEIKALPPTELRRALVAAEDT